MRIAPITRIKLLRVLLYCLYCEVAQLTNSLQGTARSAEFVLRPVIHGSGASGPGGGFPQIDDPRFSVVADGQPRCAGTGAHRQGWRAGRGPGRGPRALAGPGR